MLDEHARDARDGDAAQNHDDQADEAEIIFRPIEIASHFVVGRAVRARSDELVFEILRQPGHKRLDAVVRHAHEEHATRAATEAQKAGRPQVVVIDEDAGAEAELTDAADRLARDDAANRERRHADRKAVADLDAKRRQQLGTDERAVMFENRV